MAHWLASRERMGFMPQSHEMPVQRPIAVFRLACAWHAIPGLNIVMGLPFPLGLGLGPGVKKLGRMHQHFWTWPANSTLFFWGQGSCLDEIKEPYHLPEAKKGEGSWPLFVSTCQ